MLNQKNFICHCPKRERTKGKRSKTQTNQIEGKMSFCKNFKIYLSYFDKTFIAFKYAQSFKITQIVSK